MNRVIAVLFIAVVSVLSFISIDLYVEKSDLSAKNMELHVENVTLKNNTISCKSSLDEQNSALEKMKREYETRMKNFKPQTVVEIKEKLKIVYKDRNITKEVCSETANVIDAIRHANF